MKDADGPPDPPKRCCYLCGKQPAGTRDHAPPKVFFPRSSDAGSGEYKDQMITLSACKDCNSDLAKDDEYVFLIVVSINGNNQVADQLIANKVPRMLKARPKLANLFKPSREVVVDGQKTLAVKVNVKRFENIMRRIAKALYFLEHGEAAQGTWKVLCPALLHADLSAPDWSEILGLVAQVPWVTGKHASATSVFEYKLFKVDADPRGCAFLFRFYGHTEVLMLFKPS